MIDGFKGKVQLSNLNDLDIETREQHEFTEMLLNTVPSAVFSVNNECKITSWNKRAESIMGYTSQEIIGEDCHLFAIEPCRTKCGLMAEDVEKPVIGTICTVRNKNGDILTISKNVDLLRDGEGNVTGGIECFENITDRIKTEELLKESEKRFRSISALTTNIAYSCRTKIDGRFSIDWISGAADGITGYSSEEIKSRGCWRFLVVDEDMLLFEENVINLIAGSKKTCELRIRHKNGDIVWISSFAECVSDPLISGCRSLYGGLMDITERKKKEEEILHLSYHDQLTGLYNRRFYEEELKRLDTERNLPLTVVMGDVNGLKFVNDSFGHAEGDRLLKKVGEVIKNGCRADDIIARLGGDEFVIIFPKTDTFEAAQIIKRIKDQSLKEKVGSIDVSISFGCESKNNKEESINAIFKNAENQMYKNKLFESPSMRGKTVSTIINTLREKNKREEQHSYRVSAICKSLGEALGLAEHKIEELKSVGLLHDIGKIAIDENLLNKAGKLTDYEWREIKRHSEIGYRILSTVDEMSEMAEYVLYHHERWDGKGYPKGLKGEEISMQARIIAVADSFDAMTSERTYRKALSKEEAITEIKRCSGLQFDPHIATVFIEKVLGTGKFINPTS